MPRPDHAPGDHRFDTAEAASLVPVVPKVPERLPLNGAATDDLCVTARSHLLTASTQAPAHTTKCPVAHAAASASASASAPERRTERAQWALRPHVASGSAATPTVTRIAPPRAPSLPLLGDTLAVIFGDPIRYARGHLTRYGPVWQSSYQGQRAVFFVGEDSHRLFTHNPVQPDGSRLFACAPAYTILLPFLGQTLLNMDGEQHAAHRRALAPLFSPRYRAAFLQRLNRILDEELVARLRSDQGTLDVLPIARRIAFRAGAWLILGLDVDDPRFAHFEALWQDLPPGIFSLTPAFLPASPQTKAKRARRRLNTFLATLMQTMGHKGQETRSGVSQDSAPPRPLGLTLGAEVNASRTHIEEDGAPSRREAPSDQRVSAPSGEVTDNGGIYETFRPTVLSLLMALSPEERATLGLTDPLAFHTQSCDHALSILFAGIFTTAGIIAWAIAEVAQHPDLQARLICAVEDREESEEPHPSLTALHPGDAAPAMTAGELKGEDRESAQEGWRVQTNDSPAPIPAPPLTAVALPPYLSAHHANHAGQLAPTLRPVTLADTSNRFVQAVLKANHQAHHIAPAVARLVLHDFDYPYVPLAHAAIPTAFRTRTRASAGRHSRRNSEDTSTPPQRLYHIPKGVLAVALSGATQQLLDYGGDAGGESAPFDPDRFFLQHADRAHPHAFFTFGGGEHRCLGSAFADVEIAATLIQLARTCTFTLPAGTPFPKAVYLPSNQPRALTIAYQRRDAPAAPAASPRVPSARASSASPPPAPSPPSALTTPSAESSAGACVRAGADVAHPSPTDLPAPDTRSARHERAGLSGLAEPAEPPTLEALS